MQSFFENLSAKADPAMDRVLAGKLWKSFSLNVSELSWAEGGNEHLFRGKR